MAEWSILVVVGVAIVAVVLLIVKFHVNPVIALALGAAGIGLASGLGAVGTVETMAGGFGDTMAEAGLLSILSSDYVPASLIMAAFQLPGRVAGIDLAAAIATVTANPARATGLDDRGRIVPGLRADLVRVRTAQGVPVVREVWRAGERVV